MKQTYRVLINDIDVQPMIDALVVNKTLWTDVPNARVIVCRDVPDDILEGAWYSAVQLLPANTYVYTLMNDVLGERVGRVNIVDVKDKEMIIVGDQTLRSSYYQQFMLVLYAGDETTIDFGNGEEIKPETGDVIVYDNTNTIHLKSNGLTLLFMEVRTLAFEDIKVTAAGMQ